MINLCPPAIIYVIFSATQILIDTFKGLYNTAFMKAIVMVMVTLLLNILCEQGFGVVSWIIVFIPFILMTFIVTVLLYIFGLDAATGKLNTKCSTNTNSTSTSTSCNKDVKIDTATGNVLIYDPEYNAAKNPVYYKSPNIIVPNPHNNDYTSHPSTVVTTQQQMFPFWRSDRTYRS
jgi:hypothetical protein